MMKHYLLFCSAVMLSGLADAQGTFLPRRPIGPNLFEIPRPVVSDIDADGTNDIVLAPKWGNTAMLDVNDGAVTGFRRLVADSASSRTIHVVDLNADGYPEIIRSGLNVQSSEDTASMFVHWGGPGGLFGAPTITREGRACLPEIVADITGDQYPEVICNSGQGTIEVYQYVPAEGALRLLRSIVIGGYYFFMTTGDLDGDGVDDLVFSPSNSSLGNIRYWSPIWGLNSPATTLGTYYGSNGKPFAKDLDQNGTIDVFVTNAGGWNQYDVWLNSGDLAFQHIEDLPFGSDYGQEYWMGDPDGDGVIDLLYIRVNLILRKRFLTDLSLTPPDTVIAMNEDISSFLQADVDSDGNDDLLIIGKDERLNISMGSAMPLQFGTSVELFKWHEDIDVMGSAFTADGTQPALAFISGGSALEVDLLPMTSSTDIPRLMDLQMGNAPPPSLSDASVRSVDLDGDGDLDLFGHRSTNIPNACHIFAIENSPNGPVAHCLADEVQLGMGDAIHYSNVDLFDVSGDELSDMVITGYSVNLGGPPNSVIADQLLRRTSPFTAEPYGPALPPQAYLFRSDLDQDGDEDLIVPDLQAFEMVLHNNEGGGQFPVIAAYPWDFLTRGSYVLLDVDGDQGTDACWSKVADDTLSCYCQEVTVDGLGPLRTLLKRPFPEQLPQLEWHDMDGDGDLDILLIYRRTDGSYLWALEYHQNQGTPMGMTGEVIIVRNWFDHLPMDVDLDGDLDIVLYDQHLLSVLENNTSQVAIAEVDNPERTEVVVFPNPAQGGMVMIDLGIEPLRTVMFDLRDLQGRRVMEGSSDVRYDQLNVNGLAPGTYILEVRGSENVRLLGSAKLVVL